jgi:hypothetical protein
VSARASGTDSRIARAASVGFISFSRLAKWHKNAAVTMCQGELSEVSVFSKCEDISTSAKCSQRNALRGTSSSGQNLSSLLTAKRAHCAVATNVLHCDLTNLIRELIPSLCVRVITVMSHIYFRIVGCRTQELELGLQTCITEMVGNV